jgi:hypothetical protein
MNTLDKVSTAAFLLFVAAGLAAMLYEMFSAVRAKPVRPRITMEHDVYGDTRQAGVPEPPLPALERHPFRAPAFLPLDPDPTDQIDLDRTRAIEVCAECLGELFDDLYGWCRSCGRKPNRTASATTYESESRAELAVYEGERATLR